jgi:hypothetical protein
VFNKEKSGFVRGNWTNLHDEEEGGDDGDEEDFVIFLDVETQCVDLPEKPTTLPSHCLPVDKEAECDLFHAVLQIEPFVKDPAATAGPDPAPVLDKDLSWKRNVLDSIAEIFGKICEPFSPDMPFTFARVFEYYLAKAHKEDDTIKVIN